jgi:hypothetical protein
VSGTDALNDLIERADRLSAGQREEILRGLMLDEATLKIVLNEMAGGPDGTVLDFLKHLLSLHDPSFFAEVSGMIEDDDADRHVRAHLIDAVVGWESVPYEERAEFLVGLVSSMRGGFLKDAAMDAVRDLAELADADAAKRSVSDIMELRRDFYENRRPVRI